MVWQTVLRLMKTDVPVTRLMPLAIAKLSIDQLIPTTGVGGTLVVVHALQQKGVAKEVAVASVIVDLVSFYAAHALAVIVTLAIVAFHHDLNAPILIAAAVFAVIAVAIPWLVLKLHTGKDVRPPKWIMKIPGLGPIVESLKQARPEPMQSASVLVRASLWQLGVFLLDAGTLGVMLRALGQAAPADVVFASLTLTTMVATLSIFPGALGMFEAGSVAGLTLLGIPMETALAATLLMRLFNFWLPMIPGLIIMRKISKNSAEPDTEPSSDVQVRAAH
jgi:uncharacterized membrane protein YbhN (UPF0104 family)